ncbi:Peroxidase 19 [Asimina triloba]
MLSSAAAPRPLLAIFHILLRVFSTPPSIAAAVHVPSSTTLHQLSVDFYSKTCPQLEQLVASSTAHNFRESPISGPATIRLFFHDCFVEGCDASILLKSEPGPGVLAAERDAHDNINLAAEAYVSIQKAKAVVESKCPGVVSCADIVAIAARDFVRLAGGPYYPVKKGRRDGRVSLASTVKDNLPRSNSTVDQLLNLFQSKGLSLTDLVALSGAHSIGFSHCDQFVSRLYNFHGTQKPDPSIDPRLLKALRMSCPHRGGNRDVVAPFDVATPFTLDNMYYQNLEAKMGLLPTDQALFLDPRTRPVVQALGKDEALFFQAFSGGMDRMGSVGVKVGMQGEIRRDCFKTL